MQWLENRHETFGMGRGILLKGGSLCVGQLRQRIIRSAEVMSITVVVLTDRALLVAYKGIKLANTEMEFSFLSPVSSKTLCTMRK